MTDEEKLNYLKMFLPSATTATDLIISFFITRWTSYYSDNSGGTDYRIVYEALVDVVRWQILQEKANTVKGMMLEKEGGVTYQTSNYDTSFGWQQFLTYLLENPAIVDTTLNNGGRFSFIKVGGVYRDEQRQLDQDPNNLDGKYNIDDNYTKNFMGSNYFSEFFKDQGYYPNYYYYY